MTNTTFDTIGLYVALTMMFLVLPVAIYIISMGA